MPKSTPLKKESLKKQTPQRAPSRLCFPDKAGEEVSGKWLQGSPAGLSSALKVGILPLSAMWAVVKWKLPEKAGGPGGFSDTGGASRGSLKPLQSLGREAKPLSLFYLKMTLGRDGISFMEAVWSGQKPAVRGLYLHFC